VLFRFGAIEKPAKGKVPLTPEQLKEQMTNWKQVVQPRGYPYLFENKDAFEQFKTGIQKVLDQYGVPKGRIVVQGSSLRTPAAKDVDVAIFLSDDEFATFAQKCRDGLASRIGDKARAKMLDQLDSQIKDGYVNQFFFDRLPGATQSFPQAAKDVITPLKIKEIDLSVMKSSSKLALYPSVPF